jgi:pilus assembly protein CpaF
VGDQEAQMSTDDSIRQAAERAAASAHLWTAVQQMLGIIQSDAELQRIAAHLDLTLDRSVDERQRNELFAALTPRIGQAPSLSKMRREDLVLAGELAYDELLGISVVGPFWRDDSITEIMIDSWDRVVIERNGALELTPVRFRDLDHVRSVARNLALVTSDRALSAATPAITADVAGARVAFTIDKIVKSGVAIAIRKFGRLLDAKGLSAVGAWDNEIQEFLADCVKARANVLVSGGTGAGKTTLINALSGFIPGNERVVTIEDAFELQLRAPFWVQLQTKEAASSDDQVRVSLADLLVHTLRLRPDRIVVGEIREPSGAVVMLQAAVTGHDGTMTTIHANDVFQALNFRLAFLARTGAQMDQEVASMEVATAIDVAIQVTREQGRRYVQTVAEVDVTDCASSRIHPQELFSASIENCAVVFTRTGSVRPDSVLGQKLHAAGLLERWAAKP